MSSTVSKKDHWREVYRQQRLKNGYLWLEELEKTSSPATLASANYGKILKAIEETLNHEDSFDTGCDLLREVFPIAFGMADWGRWLIYLKGALATSQKLRNRFNQAYINGWIADIELSLTHLDEAETHFRKALEIYLDLGETGRYGLTLPQLARVYAAQGKIPEAIKLCEDTLLLGQKNEAKIVVGGGYYALSECYLRLGDFEEALAHCERAITYYEAIEKNNFVFRTKVLAVVCKIYLNRYEEAKAEADHLMALFENSENALDNLPASVYLRSSIGFMAFEQADFISAENHWQEAYRQNSMIGAPDAAASIGNNLGKVYTKLDEYEAAEEILTESLSFYDQWDDVYRWANCMDNLADLYEKMGDLGRTKDTLEAAIGRLEPVATLNRSKMLLAEMYQRLEKFQEK